MLRLLSWRRRAHLDELRRTRAGYDAALADAGTVLFQQVGHGVDAHHVSASVSALLGWEPEAFLVPGTLRDLVHPDDLATFRSVVPVGPLAPPAPAAAAAVTFVAEPAAAPARVAVEPVVRLRTVDDRWVHVLVRRTPAGPDGPVGGALVDVTVGAAERVRSDRFAAMAEASADALVVLSFLDREDPASLVIRSANARARRLFRLDGELGRPGGPDRIGLDEVFANGTAQLLRSALFDVAHTGEPLTAERLTLSEVPGTHLDLRIDRLADGSLGLTIVDVTEVVATEERLRHQATHDGLTGLPNRRLLEDRLAAALVDLADATTTIHLRDGDRPAALGGPVTASPASGADHPVLAALAALSGPRRVLGAVVVEVGALRDVNAAHGRHAGDRLLVEVARRLGDEHLGMDLVARSAGAGFTLVTTPASGEDEVLARVELVRRLLDEPMELDGHLVNPGAIVGHAVAPDDGEEPRSLLRAAELSVEAARADLLPTVVGAPFAGGVDGDDTEVPAAATATAGRGLLDELRHGLAHRELELRFQPLVELRTGRVSKVEALLRWQREDGGARPPVELLELAERSGLVQPLTRWMLGEAAAAARLLDRPGRPTVVSTNVPLRNLHHGELLSFTELLVGSGELDPRLVELELSETELMDDPVTGREVLSRLAAQGLRVVVDEFGSGYTSVSTLAGLDISGLKIDRSFVSTLADVPGDVAVVRSTVQLAHELGLEVAAEGVADAASLAVLADLGCDHVQGAHLSPPVTIDELADRVESLESALAGWVASAEATLG